MFAAEFKRIDVYDSKVRHVFDFSCFVLKRSWWGRPDAFEPTDTVRKTEVNKVRREKNKKKKQNKTEKHDMKPWKP